MRYGLALPTGGPCGDPRLVVELAVLAEHRGWDGVFLEDYIFFQGDPVAPTCDPWVALAAIAVHTERIRIGTKVTPLARRRPWKVAREAAGIDQLSGGRMTLGVGLGDTGEHVLGDVSFASLGEQTDPKIRAAILDEGLEVIAGLWTGEPFCYQGDHYRVDEVTFTPTPVQRPRVPIWVGGGYPNSGPTRRAARWDGSCLYREGSHDLSPDDVRALREAAGDRPYDISVGGRGRRGGDEVWLREIAAAGATWWSEYVSVAHPEEMREAVRRGPLRID
ncbi:MAG: LLM class flavin-dependent oxidoreductase [Actinomycetota bacterium]|nr:LLM class flavin-dependent oxidoreductase [Actinomycetota bacterium]